MVFDQNEVAEPVISGLEALPADVREVLVERALREARAPRQSTTVLDSENGDEISGVAPSKTTVVWSMQTGDPHEIRLADRAATLRRMIPGTNRPAFWAPGMPGRPPRQPDAGLYKCFLCPDSEEREMIDRAGYANRYCNDGNPDKKNRADFAALDHKEMHEQRKHIGAWRAYQRLLERTREEEQLMLLRQNNATASANTEAMQAIARLVANRESPAPAKK